MNKLILLSQNQDHSLVLEEESVKKVIPKQNESLTNPLFLSNEK